MQILIRREDFSTGCYELRVGDTALEFTGHDDSFSLPYSAVKDFNITRDRRGKAYFTVLCSGRMYEGQILNCGEIETFTSELKSKLNGVVNIEVRK